MWLCLPDLWNVLLSLPGCRTETESQGTGICSFFGRLILDSSQKWPWEKYPHRKPGDEEGQKHHGLASWDLFLLFVLKFSPTQLPCGQRVTHLPHPFSGGISEDSQIILSIPISVLPFPTLF